MLIDACNLMLCLIHVFRYHLLDRRHKWYSHSVIVDGPNSGGGGGGGGGEWPRFCNDPDFLAGFASSDGGFALHMLQATVQEVESILTEIQSSTDESYGQAGPDARLRAVSLVPGCPSTPLQPQMHTHTHTRTRTRTYKHVTTPRLQPQLPTATTP